MNHRLTIDYPYFVAKRRPSQPETCLRMVLDLATMAWVAAWKMVSLRSFAAEGDVVISGRGKNNGKTSAWDEDYKDHINYICDCLVWCLEFFKICSFFSMNTWGWKPMKGEGNQSIFEFVVVACFEMMSCWFSRFQIPSPHAETWRPWWGLEVEPPRKMC